MKLICADCGNYVHFEADVIVVGGDYYPNSLFQILGEGDGPDF